MRLLTEAEMDQVFGGQDSSNVTTLETIVVTATRQQNNGGYWIGGWSAFTQDEYYNGSGGGSACYYTSPYQALPSFMVPTPEGLRCAMTAAAVPGFDFPVGTSLHMVNSYGFRELTAGAANYGEIVLQSYASPPSGYEGPLYGTYNGSDLSLSGNHIYLYATGMVPDTNSGQYVDVNTGLTMPGIGNLTGRETQILTLAHEAAHIVLGDNANEDIMEGYGVEAVKNFRNGAGASCPK